MITRMKTYRIRTWWDRPGVAQPGEDDLGEGWCRVYDTAVVEGAEAVVAQLKNHSDAENATVEEVEVQDGLHVVVGTHWAERTILGWLIGPDTGCADHTGGIGSPHVDRTEGKGRP